MNGLGYTISFGKAVIGIPKSICEPFFVDIEELPGETPSEFNGYGGETSTRCPSYKQWNEFLESAPPTLRKLWQEVKDTQEYPVVYKITHWYDDLEQLRREAYCMSLPDHVRQRALWFVYWAACAICEFGELAAISVG